MPSERESAQVGGLSEFLRTIGPSRLAAMGALAVGLVGIFIFLVVRFSQPQMVTMFSELPIEDSAAVVRKLESRGVPFEIRNEGATILVPNDQMLRLRMALAEEGLPAGGVVGYEIFDKGDTLGATSFVQNLNHLRALEGELARTIRALENVLLARVHLVLPERQLFSREKSEPTASIVLKLRGRIDKNQIRAIQHLVASAVKDLQPGRVSIVDDSGTLLASGAGDEGAGALIGTLEERDLAYERRLKRQIEEIVTSVVGPGNARVQVNAELDYNRVTQTSETYDPEGQVVRSTQTRQESARAARSRNRNEISVANELPGTGSSGQPAEPGTAESSKKTEEIVNYEISHTTKTEVIEAGRVKRISVAVLVDGLYSKTGDGSPRYEPRPQEQLDQIASLVRSAIGFDRARGDTVEVVNLRFAPEPGPVQLEPGEESFLDLDKADYFYIAELAILLVLAILLLLFVVRPLVRHVITPPQGEGGETAQPAAVQHAEAPQLEGPDAETGQLSGRVKALLEAGGNPTAELIEVAQAAGQMHDVSVRKVGEMIGENPDEAVAIIRQWLQQKAAA